MLALELVALRLTEGSKVLQPEQGCITVLYSDSDKGYTNSADRITGGDRREVKTQNSKMKFALSYGCSCLIYIRGDCGKSS